MGGGRKVPEDDRKSGMDCLESALDVGLELAERRDGGLIDPSFW